MVVFLALYPVLAVAGLAALDAVLPAELIRIISASVVVTGAFSVVILLAVLAASWRTRGTTLLSFAWLFLFTGLVVLFLGSVVDPFLPGGESWTEELCSVASFFPLLFFTILISSPVRILILPRRSRALSIGAGILSFLAVCAVVLIPGVLLSTPKHVLSFLRPLLDTLLVEPLALLVMVIGLAQGSGPYLLTGLGLLLLIPEDILEHYKLIMSLNAHGTVSDLVSIASRLYLLNGALLAAFRGGKAPVYTADFQ
jgi:hypothetical protein